MVVNGIARCMAPSGLKKAFSFRAVELALRRQCQRDVEQKVAVPAPQIKEGIVTLPVKEELGVDLPVLPGTEDIVAAVDRERAQQRVAEQAEDGSQFAQETVEVVRLAPHERVH